jgi:hypothetical protein
LEQLPTLDLSFQTSPFTLQTSTDELPKPLRHLSVANILRTVFPKVQAKLKSRAQWILHQVKRCRTSELGAHRYACEPCGRILKVYNSCGERHCPLCHGGQRDAWIEINQPRLIPNTPYLQLVFTLPNKFSNLILANRKLLYRLLMKTAWDEIKRILRKLGIQPSAMIVLHTWNQRLKHHPHVHVLIPMAGISLDGTSWLSIENDPQFKAGTNWKLSKRFRQTFCRRLNLLNQRGKLNLPGNLACLKPTQTHFSKDHVSPMQQWLKPIAPHGFRVFIQPPPQFDVQPKSTTAPSSPSSNRIACLPKRLLKYLARYIGGGPIADHRLVRWEHGLVTFLARSSEDEEADQQLMLFADDDLPLQSTATPAQLTVTDDDLLLQSTATASQLSTKNQELSTKNSAAITGVNLPLSITKSKTEITISEEEFVRRWTIHILPKYFMRVQHYGATSRRKGTEYLAQCRKMLGIEEPGANRLNPAETVLATAAQIQSGEAYPNQLSEGIATQSNDAIEPVSTESQNLDEPNRCEASSTLDEASAEQQAASATTPAGQPQSASLIPEEVAEVFRLAYGPGPEEKPYEPTWKCTKCGKQMQCLEFQHRPSWKIVLADFLLKTSDEIQATLWTEEELRSLRDPAIKHWSIEPRTKNQEQRSFEPSTRHQEQRSFEPRTKN